MMLDFMDWDSRTQSRRVRELLLKTTETAPSKRTKECRDSQSACYFSTESSNKVESQTPFTADCKQMCLTPMKHSSIKGLKVNGDEVTFYGQPIYQPKVLLTQVIVTSHSIKPDVKCWNHTYEDYKMTVAEIIDQNSLDKSLYLGEDEIPVLVRSQKRKRLRRLHSSTRNIYSTKVEAIHNVGATNYEILQKKTKIKVKEEHIDSTKTVEHILPDVWSAKLKPFTGHDNIKDNGCETAGRTAIYHSDRSGDVSSSSGDVSSSSGDVSSSSGSLNEDSALHSEHVHFSRDTRPSAARFSAISQSYPEQNQSTCDNKSVASTCLFTSISPTIYAHADVVCDQNNQTGKSRQELGSTLRHDSLPNHGDPAVAEYDIGCLHDFEINASNHGSPAVAEYDIGCLHDVEINAPNHGSPAAAEYDIGCLHDVDINASNNSIRYDSPSSVVPDKLLFRTSDCHRHLSWFSDTESQSSTIPYALSEEDPDSLSVTVNDGNKSSGPIVHNPFSVLPKTSLLEEDANSWFDGAHNLIHNQTSTCHDCLQADGLDDSDPIHDTVRSPISMPILSLEEPIVSPIVPDDLLPDESDSDTLPDYTLLHEHSMLDDNDQDNMLYRASGDHDHLHYSIPDNQDHMHFSISDNDEPLCYSVSDYQGHISFPLSVAQQHLHYPMSDIQKHVHYPITAHKDNVMYSLSTDISPTDEISLPNYNSVRQGVHLGSP